MFKREAYAEPPPEKIAPWPQDNCMLDWLDSWEYVREDITRLLGEYQRADGGHDISSFLCQVDEADAALRLLKHRVVWLRTHLGRATPTPLDQS